MLRGMNEEDVKMRRRMLRQGKWGWWMGEGGREEEEMVEVRGKKMGAMRGMKEGVKMRWRKLR